jgi:hypothetical protein
LDGGIKMNIRFIDTSIMTNLLEIPARCDKAQEIQDDFKQAIDAGETFILPLATIIETGNHIAHISDGRLRRSIAEKFTIFIRLSLDNEAPWFYDEYKLSKEDLLYIVTEFPQKAMEKVGVGDISIIRQYEIFKEKYNAIGRIMIWSNDAHLQMYREDLTGTTRRRNL